MIEMINDDCLVAIPDKINSNSVDAIICDLPYGTTNCSWDVIIPFEKLWENYKRVLKSNGVVVLFGQEPFSSLLRLSNIKWFKYDYYWEKERITNIMQVKRRPGKTIETISVFYDKQPIYNPQMVKHEGKLVSNKVANGKLGKLTDQGNKKVFEYKDTGYRYPTQLLKHKRDILSCNLHPTQKPLTLLEELVKTFTNENCLVLDNCMGSGTTGLACKNLNRNFIGIEKDKNYFDIAVERIKK
jgi:site-specific DNA-methyltransferase (adenine-specific)